MILGYTKPRWGNLIDWKTVTNNINKVIMVEAPGFDKEDFELKVEGNMLLVEARTETNDDYRYFHRSYVLQGYSGEALVAEYTEGKLRIDYDRNKRWFKNSSHSLHQVGRYFKQFLNNVNDGIKVEIQRIFNRAKGKRKIKVQ